MSSSAIVVSQAALLLNALSVRCVEVVYGRWTEACTSRSGYIRRVKSSSLSGLSTEPCRPFPACLIGTNAMDAAGTDCTVSPVGVPETGKLLSVSLLSLIVLLGSMSTRTCVFGCSTEPGTSMFHDAASSPCFTVVGTVPAPPGIDSVDVGVPLEKKRTRTGGRGVLAALAVANTRM